MEYPHVYIIIPNWNGKSIIEKCLNSVKTTDYPNYRILVVDNGSTDGSVELIKEKFPQVVLIELRKNLGVAKAVNIGIKRILNEGADYVLLLNNDVEIIDKKWLENMIRVAESDVSIGILGCRLFVPGEGIHPKEKNLITSLLEVISYPEEEVSYAQGSVFLVKKEVIEKIGLIDEDFSPAYYEETDYCARARKANYKITYDPSTTLIHHAGTSARKKGLDWIYFTFQKNKIRFILLNSSLHRLPAVFVNFFYDIVSVFFEKERKYAPLLTKGNLNMKLRKNWRNRLDLYMKAIAVNLIDLKIILKERKNRLKKIWY